MANQTENKPKRGTTFSVGLGLLDYVNPIVYTTLSIFMSINIIHEIPMWQFLIYAAGAIVSIIFGFTIPTVKVLVGLGKFEFSLPVNLVAYVNTGIFISGSVLLLCVKKANPVVYLIVMAVLAALLYLGIYKKTKKFNPVAVLIGCIGYTMIYITCISRAAGLGLTGPIICYSIAILLMIVLVCIGCFANLMKAQIHWVIEATNIICQSMALIGTILLFCR